MNGLWRRCVKMSRSYNPVYGLGELFAEYIISKWIDNVYLRFLASQEK